MIIGKPNPSFSIEEIRNKYSDVDLLAKYFNISTLPCLINSPLRKDTHPSFGISISKDNKIKYMDFSTGDSGDIIKLLSKYWGLSLFDTIKRIADDSISKSDIAIRNTTSVNTYRSKYDSSISVKIRDWEDYDYQYWRSYGVNPELFNKIEVRPISYKIVTTRDRTTGRTTKTCYKADKYAYVYIERKEGKVSLKIYQPFNKDGFKWSSKMDRSVISLWTLMPERGDKLVICSSLKDALCLYSQSGIPTIALQGEGYSMSSTAIKELKRRFNYVYICFDTDKAGLEDSKRLSMSTGFINVIPDFHGQKDISDYYKSLNNKEDFKQLINLFI